MGALLVCLIAAVVISIQLNKQNKIIKPFWEKNWHLVLFVNPVLLQCQSLNPRLDAAELNNRKLTRQGINFIKYNGIR